MLSRTHRTHASLIILSCVLLAACAAAPSESPSPSAPSAAATPAGNPQHIVDVVDGKRITATITGISMDKLALHLRNLSPQALDVQIPIGTFFVAKDPRVQNMVARHAATFVVQPYEARDVTIDAACANVRRAEPGGTDTFGIVRASEQPELGQVLKTLNSADVQYPVEQAAIWIVTDDASYDDLGMLVGGSPYGETLIEENEAVRAMMLVDEAGLDITKYAIWRERDTLRAKVTETDLTDWLAGKMAEAPAAPQTTSQPQSTSGGEQVSQWAMSAEADYQRSADEGSAMQATGAPNTSECGDQPTAWASGDANPGAVLALYYEEAVLPSRIVIHETYNPGAIYYVEVRNQFEDRAGYQVYGGSATLLPECPHDLVIDVADIPGGVNVVEINVDQSYGWTQIDAVELTGTTIQ